MKSMGTPPDPDDNQNNKRRFKGTGNDEETTQKRIKKDSKDSKDSPPVAPNGEDTLGVHITIDEEWFKDGITEIEKKTAKSQFIDVLNHNSDFAKGVAKVVQKFLKID